MLEVVQLLLLLVRLFSAMNILPNSNFEIWNNAYNSANNSYNSKIIAIIVSKYAKDSAFGHFHGFTLGSRASCIKLDHCTLCCSVHCKLGATRILNNHKNNAYNSKNNANNSTTKAKLLHLSCTCTSSWCIQMSMLSSWTMISKSLYIEPQSVPRRYLKIIKLIVKIMSIIYLF